MQQEIPLRSYGRRKGKTLRSARTSAIENVLPEVKILLPIPLSRPAGEGITVSTSAEQEKKKDKLNPQSFFPFPVREVWFEIGFGNGEHLLHHALANPDIGMIGCEPFINGVAALCVQIGEQNVKNIRIWPDDARLLMAQMEDHSLDRLFLLHPDPWPKKRHHKRRFIQKESLDEIHRLLKPGAEFRMATDHPDLAAWMLEKTTAHPGFTQSAPSASDWPETRYQQKGLTAGRPPVYLSFTANLRK